MPATMISSDLLSQILDTARWLIVRLFIFMGLVSLFPAILVLLLEPVIIVMRSFNNRSPASSAATSRATTPASSRATSRNPSRSPSLSRRRTPQPPTSSGAASPLLRDFTTKENSSREKAMLSAGGDGGKGGFAVPVPAVVINPASVSDMVESMTVTHRKVNPSAIAASLPSSPSLSSF